MPNDRKLPMPKAESSVHPPVAFLDRTYDEALALTRAARGCVAAGLASPIDGASLGSALTASFESLRLTVRITQIMAWCLAQKAIFAGELPRDPQTIEKFALGARELCLGGDEHAGDCELTHAFRGLLARSRALYVRVLRLDELMHREVMGEVAAPEFRVEKKEKTGNAAGLNVKICGV
jgi:regulator of CtrA degradation